MGEDGEAIAEYMLSVMEDERAKTADRIEAGKWLANRGFGTAPLVIEAGVTAEQSLQDYFRKLSLEDLEAMRAILQKYRTDDDEITARNQVALRAHTTLARFVARFGCRLLSVAVAGMNAASASRPNGGSCRFQSARARSLPCRRSRVRVPSSASKPP